MRETPSKGDIMTETAQDTGTEVLTIVSDFFRILIDPDNEYPRTK